MAKLQLMLMVMALGAVLVVEGKKTMRAMRGMSILTNNKIEFKILPETEFPEVLNLLVEAIKEYDVTPKHILTASEIVQADKPKTKKCYNVEFADEEGRIYQYAFSHENGEFAEQQPPSSFEEEKVTELIKAGNIDEARKLMAKMRVKILKTFDKRKPK